MTDRYDEQAREIAVKFTVLANEAEITLDEWEDACTRYGSNTLGATTNGVLRSRLAAALEACR